MCVCGLSVCICLYLSVEYGEVEGGPAKKHARMSEDSL